MKNITRFFLIGIITTILLTSCSSGGDKFLGTWKIPNYDKATITITKQGETAYRFKYVLSRTPNEVDQMPYVYSETTTYKDGNLISMGEVIASYSDGKIIYRDDAYVKEK